MRTQVHPPPAKIEEIPLLIPVGEDTSEEWTEKFYFAHRTIIEISKDVRARIK